MICNNTIQCDHNRNEEYTRQGKARQGKNIILKILLRCNNNNNNNNNNNSNKYYG